MSNTPLAASARPARFLSRLLSCIRYDEAILLQGPPLIGACLAIESFTASNIVRGLVLAFGSVCLVTHIYTLNDWAGSAGDLNDPNRAPFVFTAKDINRNQILFLVIALLIVSLASLALLGMPVLMLAVVIAGLGALYSVPAVGGKGRPIFNTTLHFVGATLHCLAGYATFASIDGRSLAIASFFGLVFAAGHLTHEARDCESDRANGVQTNAVAFGRVHAFFASLILFSVAYGLLTALALKDAVPRVLAFAGLLYPLHLLAAYDAIRTGLSFESLQRLKHRYRLIFAAIGMTFVISVVAGW